MRQKIWSLTQSLHLYSICALCNQYHSSKMAVCFECIELMPVIGPACQHCAHPLPDTHLLICGQCIKKKPDFDYAFIHYAFTEPLRSLLHQFKYQNGLYLTSFFSHLIMQATPQATQLPECLIPVPMHPKKIMLRGFNQATVLAKSLAKKLKIPYEATRCTKTLNTNPQTSLDSEQRKKNLRHTFQTKKLPFQHVAIIDDLLTTGSTANELASTLKKSGIQQVDIWCCARTVATYTPHH